MINGVFKSNLVRKNLELYKNCFFKSGGLHHTKYFDPYFVSNHLTLSGIKKINRKNMKKGAATAAW